MLIAYPLLFMHKLSQTVSFENVKIEHDYKIVTFTFIKRLYFSHQLSIKQLLHNLLSLCIHTFVFILCIIILSQIISNRKLSKCKKLCFIISHLITLLLSDSDILPRLSSIKLSFTLFMVSIY